MISISYCFGTRIMCHNVVITDDFILELKPRLRERIQRRIYGTLRPMCLCCFLEHHTRIFSLS